MPYTVQINEKAIQEKFAAATFNKARVVARQKAEDFVKKKKDEFLQEFIENDITQEILAGPEPNYGVSGQNGNLFSFLGFDDDAKPIQKLYKFLDENIFLGRDFQYDRSNTSGSFSRSYSYARGSSTFVFRMKYPTLDDLKDPTDMEQFTQKNNESGWGYGRSWAISIERGIPGLNRYKHSDDPKVLGGESRSGFGLQRKNDIRAGAQYRPQKYMTELLKILTQR